MSSFLSFIESFLASCIEPFLIHDAEAANMLLIIFLVVVGAIICFLTLLMEFKEDMEEKKE